MKNEIIEKLNDVINEIEELDDKDCSSVEQNNNYGIGLNSMVGKKVIIRTYTAGVHFGTLVEKSGTEVILKNSRRLYYWVTANKGLSLSEVSQVGLANSSKVCAVVPLQWLDAIEIIPCSVKAIKNVENQNEYTA